MYSRPSFPDHHESVFSSDSRLILILLGHWQNKMNRHTDSSLSRAGPLRTTMGLLLLFMAVWSAHPMLSVGEGGLMGFGAGSRMPPLLIDCVWLGNLTSLQALVFLLKMQMIIALTIQSGGEQMK